MKKLLALLFVALFFATTMSGSVATQPHSTIVCIGDSITKGAFSYTGGWPQQLQTRLGNNTTVINQGVDGDTTTGMLTRFNSSVLALQPRYVIIMGGTNDYYTPLATTEGNIAAMCNLSVASNTTPVLCTITPTVSSEQGFVQLSGINTWIIQYARTHYYALIDFYSVINDPTNPGHPNPALIEAAGTHPNPAGYIAMGNAIDLSIFGG
jgi:acyl-CoA thioesterase-1